MTPTAEDVARFLGQGQDSTVLALAGEHLPVVTDMVRAYVRDKGFDEATGEPADDLGRIIIASTARLVTNPAHTVTEQPDASYQVRYGIFNGWTLPELAVLHRYRKRAL
jgi:hypothetical protein